MLVENPENGFRLDSPVMGNRPSVAVSFTFRPSLDDHQKIYQLLDRVLRKATRRAIRYGGNEQSGILLHRLQQILKKLDFDTHRKGIIILVFIDHEKVIYLKDEIATRVLFCNDLSVIQLIGGIKKEFGFYMGVFGSDKLTVYEYKNQLLRQVSFEKFSFGLHEEEANQLAVSIIEKFYAIEEKPIFLLGGKSMIKLPELNREVKLPIYILQVMSTLFSSMYLLKICTVVQRDETNLLSNHQLFRISVAELENTLIFSLLKVLDALRQHRNGLLLVDRSFLTAFREKTLLSVTEKFRQQFLLYVERFLHRGNRVEITKPDLLHQFGGIALLQSGGTKDNSRLYPVSFRSGDVLF